MTLSQDQPQLLSKVVFGILLCAGYAAIFAAAMYVVLHLQQL
jgi:hypothetical protein